MGKECVSIDLIKRNFDKGNFQFVMDSISYITSDDMYNHNGTTATDKIVINTYNQPNVMNVYWTKSLLLDGATVNGYAYLPRSGYRKTVFVGGNSFF